MTETEFDDDHVPRTEPAAAVESAPQSSDVSEETLREDEFEIDLAMTAPVTRDDRDSGDVAYPEDQIDLRGPLLETRVELIKVIENLVGAEELDRRVKSTGSWENLMFRATFDETGEDLRTQEALAALDPSDLKAMASRYVDESGKTLLRSSFFKHKAKAGETSVLSGEKALLAFSGNGEKSGFCRIPLYNTGITIDVTVPTGNDIQTLMANCVSIDMELGSGMGAHYFAYNDVMVKNEIWNFIYPLITGSSYDDWRKTGRLASVVKLPDIYAIVANIAAMWYRDGFDGFRIPCTSFMDETKTNPCRHVEVINANIFDMITTRFPVLSKDAIDFLTAARHGNAQNTLAQITDYQTKLGLEGERITFKNITFIMRIPSLTEHFAGGRKFIADIKNEISGDNNKGQLDCFGLRYIRTFLPWIASIETVSKEGGISRTSDPYVITRVLERLEDEDLTIRDILRAYINKTQLTYIGYPNVPCTQCGHVADTPSGLYTFDPFSAFFTLAFLYSK